MQVVVRVRPMNERELFASDATAVQVDEQDPQQMQVSASVLLRPPPAPKPTIVPPPHSQPLISPKHHPTPIRCFIS